MAAAAAAAQQRGRYGGSGSSSRPQPRVMGAPQLPRRLQRDSHVRRVKDVTEADWEAEVLKADVPVLVDFWAPWCGPCKLVAPLMAWAEQEHAGALKVVKVEHDQAPALVERYKVYGLPTFIVFKGGEEVAGSKSEGAIGKAALAAYVKKFALEPVSAA